MCVFVYHTNNAHIHMNWWQIHVFSLCRLKFLLWNQLIISETCFVWRKEFHIKYEVYPHLFQKRFWFCYCAISAFCFSLLEMQWCKWHGGPEYGEKEHMTPIADCCRLRWVYCLVGQERSSLNTVDILGSRPSLAFRVLVGSYKDTLRDRPLAILINYCFLHF